MHYFILLHSIPYYQHSIPLEPAWLQFYKELEAWPPQASSQPSFLHPAVEEVAHHTKDMHSIFCQTYTPWTPHQERKKEGADNGNIFLDLLPGFLLTPADLMLSMSSSSSSSLSLMFIECLLCIWHCPKPSHMYYLIYFSNSLIKLQYDDE